MQRIRKVRWAARNIGGDRCFAKLRYVTGENFTIATGTSAQFYNQAINIGSWPSTTSDATSLYAIMGNTPNLSTLASLYQRYRIRGIKLRLTFWQQGGVPCCLYTNATGTTSQLGSGPSPPFVTPTITVLPEQRWAKYRVCQATVAGGKATSLSVYYSVNKVFGPDNTVRNDIGFTGETQQTSPYWSEQGDPNSHPVNFPWMQYGIFTLSGQNVAAGNASFGVLKIEQTVYTEFFGKRTSIE